MPPPCERAPAPAPCPPRANRSFSNCLQQVSCATPCCDPALRLLSFGRLRSHRHTDGVNGPGPINRDAGCMLQAIRSKAGSFVVKALFALLILTFGIWGIGDI